MNAGAEWELPVPLTRVRGCPDFPVSSLPKALAEWVTAEAEATQTPVALAGVLALVVGAATMAGRVEVEVRKGWREPTNLFGVVALPPGNRKSAVMADAERPLLAAEEALIEQQRPDVAAAQSRRRILELRLKNFEAKAARAKSVPEAREYEAEAERLAEELAATAPQYFPRLVADDATPEAVAGLLAEQNGRLAVLSAEGGIFDTIAGRYSNGVANLDVFLKGHAGDDLRVDRRGRDAEIIKHPALTMALAVQPAVLVKIGESGVFSGRGFLARILYAVPASNVGSRAISPAPVSDRVAEAYVDVLEKLAMEFANSTETAVVVFGVGAEAHFRTFEEAHEPRLAPVGGDLAHIADWAAKLPGAVARLAGILHVVAHPDAWPGPIDASTVDAAIEIGHYFASQAIATFEIMAADPMLDKARLLGKWIADRTSFTRREAHRAHQTTFLRVADLDEVLELLIERGWVRPAEIYPSNPRGGRRKSERFIVNPFVAVTNGTELTESPPAGGFVTSVTAVSPSRAAIGPLCEVCSRPLVSDSDLGSGMLWHESCRPEFDEGPTECDFDVEGLIHLSDGPVIWPTSEDIERWSSEVEMAR